MTDTLTLKLSARRTLTTDIAEFTLVSVSGAVLPGCKAGAHLTLKTPSGAWRSYSVVNAGLGSESYVIAVKRETQGRGGSASLHDDLAVGDEIPARAPRSAIQLADGHHHILIAGGIGITPMLAMLRKALSDGKDATLIYLSRSPEQTAYLEELAALESNVIIHHDLGDPTRGFDLWPYLENPDTTHLYYCGPAGLMQAIYSKTVHWPRIQVHSEDFGGVSAFNNLAEPFQVTRQNTGEVFEVPADQSILSVLRNNGVVLKSSCESGTCGTCKMRVVSGEVQHRDLFLNDADKQTHIMPCVSRAKGNLVVEI